MRFDVKINNKPETADNYEYIVATLINHEYWYYGAYSDHERAVQAVEAIENGVIFHNTRGRLKE